MTCEHERHRKADRSRLFLEALTVGLALVPAWFSVSRLTEVMRIGRTWKPFLDLVATGALLHLAAEESGVNAWYLENGHAARAAIIQSQTVDDRVSDTLDWLRAAGCVDGR